MNAPHPDLMSANDRCAEAAQLLAQAILRRRARQSTEKPPKRDAMPLDCPGASRLHGPRKDTGGGASA